MGIWSRLLGRPKAASSATPDRWFVDWVRGGPETASGMSVTPDSAMRTAAVWACVRARSDDLGKLPLHLYRKRPDGGKERADDHPLYALLHDRPNARMTSFEFRQLMQTMVDLRGNAYAYIDRNLRGQVINLWPLMPQKVTVLQSTDGDLFYRVQGIEEPIPAENILHLRGLSLDGITGLSPIAYHRETIGLTLAAERYGGEFFGNGAQPLGAIELPATLSDKAAAALRDSWNRRHQGTDNAHKLAVLDGGMKYQAIGIPNTDAQYIELRTFQIADIGRIYRIPPHKIGDLSRGTFSNIEQQAMEYVTDCLLPEARRWEQTIWRDLLTEKEQSQYYVEFAFDSLLRGDTKARYDAYAIARNWGWLNVDEIRALENMNPLPDGKGTIYLQPLNMVEAGTPPPQLAPNEPPKLPAPKQMPTKQQLRSFKALASYLAALEEKENA